jgi:hypothetical protein
LRHEVAKISWPKRNTSRQIRDLASHHVLLVTTNDRRFSVTESVPGIQVAADAEPQLKVVARLGSC